MTHAQIGQIQNIIVITISIMNCSAATLPFRESSFLS